MILFLLLGFVSLWHHLLAQQLLNTTVAFALHRTPQLPAGAAPGSTLPSHQAQADSAHISGLFAVDGMRYNRVSSIQPRGFKPLVPSVFKQPTPTKPLPTALRARAPHKQQPYPGSA